MEPESPMPPPSLCASCGSPLRTGAGFCSACGHRAGDPPPAVRKIAPPPHRSRRVAEGLRDVRFVIGFYVALLGIQILTALFASSTEQAFPALVVGDVLFGALVVNVAVLRRRDVIPLCVRAGFGVRGYGLIVLAAPLVFAAVHLFAAGLQRVFHAPNAGYLDDFEGRGFGWAVWLIAVNPALFEELAFRGLLFGALIRRVGLVETLAVTSVAFAILHLSPIMLPTHVGLGLYLGWLRHRSGSLYPAMTAHFLHNLLVILDERCRWLS